MKNAAISKALLGRGAVFLPFEVKQFFKNKNNNNSNNNVNRRCNLRRQKCDLKRSRQDSKT